MGETFKKFERIYLRRDFDKLFSCGKRHVNKYFVVVYLKNELGYSRIGITIKRKFGKAHKRNKLKRYIREIYRRNKSLFPQEFDIIFLPRKTLSKEFDNLTFEEIKNILLDIAENLK
ncbi:ribonuclease P [Marinitoga sp. 1135]|uniref:Ribonuclease P protein component n=1 Tax=Marinitoga piezophila (strain DSM 14283 / JCM 11233 / KA3) TaxID=443254 RepID=H2J6X1_MARPK|nr:MULTISPECIES: ribonuclease P protein component [Marinitoga]AEX85236.1 ribonuclease P protein component [Marinitoga piezophila KA3]APT75726.1 ribonuclease P [Marinitoga sp. 1137]NUU95463.1 ribonuclease P [Marinitoga sp. 1135]NUU97391.1 ribonuclease P [Marinitoga sp. 1138]